MQYEDGEKRYIIAPRGIKKGDKLISSEKTDILPGNAMKIKNIPSGTFVHCVEGYPGKGAIYGRSAGESISVQGPDTSGKFMQIRLPSGEIRLVYADCMATIGQVGNEERKGLFCSNRRRLRDRR